MFIMSKYNLFTAFKEMLCTCAKNFKYKHWHRIFIHLTRNISCKVQIRSQTMVAVVRLNDSEVALKRRDYMVCLL